MMNFKDFISGEIKEVYSLFQRNDLVIVISSESQYESKIGMVVDSSSYPYMASSKVIIWEPGAGFSNHRQLLIRNELLEKITTLAELRKLARTL